MNSKTSIILYREVLIKITADKQYLPGEIIEDSIYLEYQHVLPADCVSDSLELLLD